jgi:anaerobic selenocysteine-containing dehydrogenase
MDYAVKKPEALKSMPFILGKTLGKALGSVHLAALWGLLQVAPKAFHENAARAGFKPGATLGEEIFQRIIDPENNFAEIKTADGKINLYIPELLDELQSIYAATEEALLAMDVKFPLVLMAGRHISMNANTLMRDPAWNEGKRACTLAMHPDDAKALNLTDGQQVRVTTEAGSEEIELEVTDTAHRGHVVMPHGFGLVYNGVKYGANANRLTKNTHRDQFGTPIHRYVPCRVEGI